MNDKEFEKWQEEHRIKSIKQARLYQLLSVALSFVGMICTMFVGKYIQIFSLMVAGGVWGTLIYHSQAEQPKNISNIITGSVIAILLIHIIYTGIKYPSDCYTDWDGRSNPTVCD
jgi:hypothetical protein